MLKDVQNWGLFNVLLAIREAAKGALNRHSVLRPWRPSADFELE